MKVEQSYVIDGAVVEKISSFEDLEVYSYDPDENSTTLFFCKKGKVVKKLFVSADCAQNCGFISNLAFGNAD